MCAPQGGSAALRHSNEPEMAFVLQLNEGLDEVLNRNVGWDASALEEVHLLDPAELRVDGLDAASQVLGSASQCDVNTSFTERIAKEIHSRAVRFEAISFEAALM